MKSTALVWFTKDLRSSDHYGLQQAMTHHERVLGVFCFDPKHFQQTTFGFRKTGHFRAQFLIETITELKESLAHKNIPLFVYNAAPETCLPELIRKYQIDTVYSQNEWTSEETETYAAVKRNTPQPIEWNMEYDQFLYHPKDLPFSVTDLPEVFTQFRKKCERFVTIRPVLQMPSFTQSPIENTTQIPSLSTLGFTEPLPFDSRSAFPFKGGEQQALQRIQEYFWDSQRLSLYKKTRNGLLGTMYSSKLSAWLANGSISARMIYQELQRYEATVTKNQSTYWLFFELIWRDFFKYISLKHGNALFHQKGIKNRSYKWHSDQEQIQQWINGQTPEPFVNANMIELQQTGWMSNRGRQNVASYFAKTQQLDWRVGAAYFESLLIDYDVHSNYGNWNYVAGTGNDPRDRTFNIPLQAKRYDPKQQYQSLWLQPTLF